MASGDKEILKDTTVSRPIIRGEKVGINKEKKVEAQKETAELREKSIAFARPLLKKQMKALIARDLFSMSEYFQIMNSEDETIKKAVEVITQKGTYEKILSGK
jgi:hypothetical protein